MSIRQHLRTIILSVIITALSAFNHAYAAGKQDRTNDRLLDEMRKYFNTTHTDSMYKAAKRYRDYNLRANNMPNFYKGWQAEIMYDINFNHFYMAMRKTVVMSQDMKKRRCTDELYNATFMIGVIYSLQGNKQLAKEYFHKALAEAGQQKPTNLIQIYKDLANVEMDDEPEEAMKDLDRAIKIIKAADMKYEYSDAIAFKTIIAFTMRDWKTVNRLYDEYMRMQKEYGNDFSTTYYRYVKICKCTADGNYREAITWADSLTNIDRYKFKTKIHEIAGDTAAAFTALKEYIHAKDSVNSASMVQDLSNAANEVETAAMQIKADEARTMKTVMRLTVFVALVVIIMLAFVIRKRNSYLKKLKQKNRDLEILRDKAEEAERMKSSILKNMSHEVRTPLNIIAGFSQIISQPDLNLSAEERADIAERVTASSDNIVKIINDLLFVASKESISYTARNETVSCNDVCRKAVETCRKTLPEDIKLGFNSAVGDDFMITTNREGMEHILDSLLDNARKFTSEGSITVECHCDKAKNTVTIGVSDTGNTIPKDLSEKIFDLFYKIDNNKEGLGVGLALSRRIARQLGGDIRLDTEYHEGTRFIVTLPAK